MSLSPWQQDTFDIGAVLLGARVIRADHSSMTESRNYEGGSYISTKPPLIVIRIAHRADESLLCFFVAFSA